jgi:hypothetical protein
MVLQITLDVEVDLLQRRHGLRVRLGPQAAVGRLTELLDDRRQGPGVGLAQEVLVLLVQHVGAGQLLVHPVVHDARGRVEAEQVVDRGRQLEGTLVAVPLHRGDPARVDHPGPEHP